MELRSGLCAGQSSSSIPNSPNHLFMATPKTNSTKESEYVMECRSVVELLELQQEWCSVVVDRRGVFLRNVCIIKASVVSFI